MKGYLVAAICCAWPAGAAAQNTQPVSSPPPNIVLSNYDNVPVGPYGGLEGPAFSARVGDPSAAWFNPAGLSRPATAQISGGAGVYRRTTLRTDGDSTGGSEWQNLPNYVGFMFPAGKVTAGVALLTTNSWTQETDTQKVVSGPSAIDRLSYSADSKFEQRIASGAVGYQLASGLRLGGGITFSMMNLRQVQTISDRIADATGLRSLLVSARFTNGSTHLRAQAGAQFDTSSFRTGIAVRTPGIGFFQSGSMVFDGVVDFGAASAGSSLFDDEAAAEFKLPWEIQAGGAYVRDRFELELDVHAYTSIGAYQMLATGQELVIYGDAGRGTPPEIVRRAFDGLTSASDGVVDVAIGGQVKPIAGRDFRIHAGIATSQSPVGAADEVFTHGDLVSWTLGASGTLARLQFAIGFNRRSGTTDAVRVPNVLSAEPFSTRVKVATGGMIYSIGYRF